LPPGPPPAPPALQAAPQAPPKAARISPPSPPLAKAEHARPPPAKPAPVKAAAAEPVKASTPAKSSHGVAAVQIGAVSSTALADKAWSEAVGLAPGLAVGKGKGVEKIDKDGHVLYRTAVTGFASKADAAAFCARLKAAGKACFVK
jgi:hypothetical protein